MWAHLEGERGLALLREVCGFHPLALDEAGRDTPIPKVEDFGDYIFGEFYVLDDGAVKELSFFFSPKYLITYSRLPLSMPEPEAEAHFLSLASLLRFILRSFMRRAWERVELLSERYEQLERALLDEENLGRELYMSLRGLKADVMELRKPLIKERWLLRELVQEARDLFPPEDIPFLSDLVDYQSALEAELDSLDAGASQLIEMYLEMRDIRTNDIMRALTVLATVLLPAMVIAGIYGMNFRHMPELHWTLAYPLSLAVMALAGGTMYWYFKRRGWL